MRVAFLFLYLYFLYYSLYFSQGLGISWENRRQFYKYHIISDLREEKALEERDFFKSLWEKWGFLMLRNVILSSLFTRFFPSNRFFPKGDRFFPKTWVFRGTFGKTIVSLS